MVEILSSLFILYLHAESSAVDIAEALNTYYINEFCYGTRS